jgi:hypothetical protein
LETALSEGLHLLLTDCDTNTLMNNEKLETVIRNQTRFISSDKPFKLQIGQQEIECSPKFRFESNKQQSTFAFDGRCGMLRVSLSRLYLHTVSLPVQLPKVLAAYTLTMSFHMTVNDLEEIFLSRFMIREKPHIDTEQYTLLQVRSVRVFVRRHLFVYR